MYVTSKAIEFKRAHPHNYWVRIVCFAFIMVFAALWVVGGADADAPASGVTDNELVTDSFEANVNFALNGPPGGRQLNGTLWHFGTNIVTYSSDHEIVASISSDNGTTWFTWTIMDNSFPGFEIGGTPWMVSDCGMLSNNSVLALLVLSQFDTATRKECWLFAHWNNSDLDQWELIDVYSNPSYSIDLDPTMVVGVDDDVMICYERSSVTHYDFLNPSTRVLSGNIKTGLAVSGAGRGPWALCNSTGIFFIGGCYGATENIRAYTADGSFTLVYSFAFSSSYKPTDQIILADDTFVSIGALTIGGYLRLHYWNETATDSRYLIDSGTGDLTIAYPRLGQYNDSDTTVRIIGYSNADDTFVSATGDYFIDSEVWQIRWGDGVWTETDDSQKTYLTYQPHDLFPRTIDPVTAVLNRTMLPNAGFYAHITDYTVADDEDDLHEIHDNATVWPGAPYYHYNPFYEAPEDEPPDNGVDLEPASGICSSGWIAVMVLILMLFVLVGVTARTVL